MNEIIAKQNIDQFLEDFRSKLPRQPRDREAFSCTFDAYLWLYGRGLMSKFVNEMGLDKDQVRKMVELSKTAFYDKYFK